MSEREGIYGDMLLTAGFGIPVIYDRYALDRPVFVAGIGIVARDRESLEKALDDHFLASCGISQAAGTPGQQKTQET